MYSRDFQLGRKFNLIYSFTSEMAGPSMVLPGGPLEICFSFDTTVSMTVYVDQVKARLQDMVQKLKSDIPGIKIALFGHGDYYQASVDNKSPYVTRYIDFTDDVAKLCTFIKDAAPTVGGDWDECYELVMKEVREKLTWSPGTNRVLVMVGDAHPDPPREYDTKDDFKGMEKLDWTQEIKNLLNSKIRCYGVYCKTGYSNARDKSFFQTLSKKGQGSLLELSKFDSIFDFMMAICYREHGEDALFAYEAEVRGRSGGAAKDVHHMLTTLKKSVSNASNEGGAKPASKSVTKARQSARKETKATCRLVKPKPKIKPVKTSKIKPVKPSPQNKRKATVKTRQAPAQYASKPRVKVAGSKRLAQYKPKHSIQKLQKLRREKVPETNFALRDFPWSSWKILMSSEHREGLVPVIGPKGKITEHRQGLILFKGRTTRPALYELAVRPKGCRLKKVVYAKVCPYFSCRHAHWCNVLIESNTLKRQINNIVPKQGGDILVRRLILKKYRRYETIPDIVRNYDYVWAPEEGAEKYRELKKGSYVILEEMDVD